MVGPFKKNRKMKNKQKKQTTKKRTKRRRKRKKELNDLKNQDLKIIFEDITSHKREVKEIEDLTFQQLINLKNKLTSVIKSKQPITANIFEENELEKEQEAEEREEEKREEE